MQAQDIPYGYCHCGCGEKTTLMQKTEARVGRVKGEPNKFIPDHYARTLAKPITHGTRMGHRKGCRCDPCVEAARAHVREWKRNYPERARTAQRRTRLKHKYGITEDDWQRLFEAQAGRCAICRRAKKLCVDHDHDTGKVRGLLCIRCNLSIGRFNHDPEVLRNAAEYLSMEDCHGVQS